LYVYKCQLIIGTQANQNASSVLQLLG